MSGNVFFFKKKDVFLFFEKKKNYFRSNQNEKRAFY